jgi:CubicO group peptidase (beta-lactamase class C family)
MSIRFASARTKFHIAIWSLSHCLIPAANVIAGEPVFPGKEWVEKTPCSQGVDPAKLDAALKYLEDHCGEDGIGEVVVIRNGYMIWKGDHIDKQHSTWSIGKSFTSTALGLLIEDGLCSLDDFASQYEPLLSGKYSRVRLRHFNTMTSGYDAPKGLRWREPVPEYGDWSPVPYIPGTPLFAPGEAYLYWDEAMMMFGRILTRIAKQDLYSFFEKRIANPIGIDKWDWETEGEVNGMKIRAGCGMVWISARNLARFGYLFLNRGNWNGKQLIDGKWIDEATSAQVSPSTPLYRDICEDPGKFMDGGHFDADGRGIYGYHWWMNGMNAEGKRDLPDAPEGMFYSIGYPHNMLFVIPEWNMVIVRLGDEPDGRPSMDRMTLWNNVIKKIGDAFIEKQQ